MSDYRYRFFLKKLRIGRLVYLANKRRFNVYQKIFKWNQYIRSDQIVFCGEMHTPRETPPSLSSGLTIAPFASLVLKPKGI